MSENFKLASFKFFFGTIFIPRKIAMIFPPHIMKVDFI